MADEQVRPTSAGFKNMTARELSMIYEATEASAEALTSVINQPRCTDRVEQVLWALSDALYDTRREAVAAARVLRPKTECDQWEQERMLLTEAVRYGDLPDVMAAFGTVLQRHMKQANGGRAAA
ncbi:hypothetical protein ACFOGJ_08740 [Marinibaculum pumilum]|uniref:Chorismate mutase n=1 Tax=Marinibaculum pumilum TaxID=1766165 RepID=A0ABV7KYA0_9PROT